MANITNQPIKNIWASDTTNTQSASSLDNQGIEYGAEIVSKQLNGALNTLSNQVAYAQYDGGAYNNDLTYNVGNIVTLNYAQSNKEYRTTFKCINDNAGAGIQGIPPIKNATMTTQNGIMYAKGGDGFNTTYWSLIGVDQTIIEQLQQEVAHNSAQSTQNAQSITETNQALQGLQQDLNHHTTQINQNTQDITENTQELQDLKSEVQTNTQDITENTQEIVELKNQFNPLNQEVAYSLPLENAKLYCMGSNQLNIQDDSHTHNHDLKPCIVTPNKILLNQSYMVKLMPIGVLKGTLNSATRQGVSIYKIQCTYSVDVKPYLLSVLNQSLTYKIELECVYKDQALVRVDFKSEEVNKNVNINNIGARNNGPNNPIGNNNFTCLIQFGTVSATILGLQSFSNDSTDLCIFLALPAINGSYSAPNTPTDLYSNLGDHQIATPTAFNVLNSSDAISWIGQPYYESNKGAIESNQYPLLNSNTQSEILFRVGMHSDSRNYHQIGQWSYFMNNPVAIPDGYYPLTTYINIDEAFYLNGVYAGVASFLPAGQLSDWDANSWKYFLAGSQSNGTQTFYPQTLLSNNGITASVMNQLFPFSDTNNFVLWYRTNQFNQHYYSLVLTDTIDTYGTQQWLPGPHGNQPYQPPEYPNPNQQTDTNFCWAPSPGLSGNQRPYNAWKSQFAVGGSAQLNAYLCVKVF